MAATSQIRCKVTSISDTEIVLTPLEPTTLKTGRDITTITIATADITGVDQFHDDQPVDVIFQKK
jgi:hypothetical protein